MRIRRGKFVLFFAALICASGNLLPPAWGGDGAFVGLAHAADSSISGGLGSGGNALGAGSGNSGDVSADNVIGETSQPNPSERTVDLALPIPPRRTERQEVMPQEARHQIQQIRCSHRVRSHRRLARSRRSPFPRLLRPVPLRRLRLLMFEERAILPIILILPFQGSAGLSQKLCLIIILRAKPRSVAFIKVGWVMAGG